jgi:hypothetical protein
MLVVRNHAQVTIQKRVTSLPYWASIRIIWKSERHTPSAIPIIVVMAVTKL